MTRSTRDKATDISIGANIDIHWYSSDGGMLLNLFFSFKERERQMVADNLHVTFS